MNTIVFLSGMGAGALLATILMIVVMMLLLRLGKKGREQAAKQHVELIALWKKRNTTGERTASAVEKLAEHFLPSPSNTGGFQLPPSKE